jgi:hypothetical protein
VDAGGHDAKGSHIGKEHDADAAHGLSAANGFANGSHDSPKDQDMEDSHAEDPGHEAVSVEATRDQLDNTVADPEPTTNDPSNSNNDDENGEDVVEEAAEDTVIY